MTTRKEALQDLLAKVEAGDDVGFRRSNRAVFSTPCQDIALQLREEHCRHAYKGSLDAAKSLNEAVLPGWLARPECGGAGAGVKFWGCTLEDWDTGARHDVHNMECPARAWLIVIIKALIAQEPT